MASPLSSESIISILLSHNNHRHRLCHRRRHRRRRHRRRRRLRRHLRRRHRQRHRHRHRHPVASLKRRYTLVEVCRSLTFVF